MVFSSLSFIFVFLPAFLALYYCVPSKNKNTLLLLGSLVFYSMGEPFYLFLILASIPVNYLLGLGISKYKKGRAERLFLFVVALIFDFGLLLFFKYTNFFIENINLLLRACGLNRQIFTLNITLPLGISFYTFQIVSYIIDVYRGKTEAEKSFVNIGVYICMFPQLIAGPIVIYSDISEALKERTVSIRNIDSGLKTFIIGLGYKVIIANRIGTLWNEVCTIGYESISTPLAWMGAAAYAMQLYFDFCGYSVMAIGLGEMLGFKMPDNFRFPYMARSVTDFWRRWHITLGAWFKEYVYIPLGGNRKGKKRAMCNLFIVWFLVGFWHGAAWNFILWGVFIFVLLAIEKNWTLRFLNAGNIFAKILSHLYILLYIGVSWVIFAITDFSELGVYLSKMFPLFAGANKISLNDFWRLLETYAPLLTAGIIFSTDYPKRLWEKLRGSILELIALLIIFWYSVYLLSVGVNNPFLYFRF
ncbi:MAG: MBOAT family protein [Lachnospiraceae bacterium]|nr:MBOAT family protein [Lachnospiraceae bacterium]